MFGPRQNVSLSTVAGFHQLIKVLPVIRKVCSIFVTYYLNYLISLFCFTFCFNYLNVYFVLCWYSNIVIVLKAWITVAVCSVNGHCVIMIMIIFCLQKEVCNQIFIQIKFVFIWQFEIIAIWQYYIHLGKLWCLQSDDVGWLDTFVWKVFWIMLYYELNECLSALTLLVGRPRWHSTFWKSDTPISKGTWSSL